MRNELFEYINKRYPLIKPEDKKLTPGFSRDVVSNRNGKSGIVVYDSMKSRRGTIPLDPDRSN